MSRNPSSTFLKDPDDAIAALAATWVARHDRGLSPGELRDFTRWVDQDPRHMPVYCRIARTWAQLEQTRQLTDLNQMAERVLEDAAERQQVRGNHTRLWALTSMAAGLALALILGQTGQDARTTPPAAVVSPQPGYTVLDSSARHIDLPDGSIAELNGDSLIYTEYTATERRVTLLSGEVHFSVAKNPDRPFIVMVDNVTVRAVGTAFSVKRQRDAVEILVTEGKVSVDDHEHGTSLLPEDQPVLSVGQMVVVSPQRNFEVVLTDLDHEEIERAMAWHSTRLVFDGTPLPQVLDAFNRYNTHKLLLGNPALSSRSLTGVFKAENVDGFVRLLELGADIKAQRTPNGDIILRPDQ